MDFLIKAVDALNSVIWSPALVALCLLAGLYLTVRTRFVQVRHFRQMIRNLFTRGRKRSSRGTSPFQAFSLTLSGCVGTGNVVGVATAIGFGGPGAIVWMWIMAFFGAGTAFTEATLAQIYKEPHGDDFRGGPAYYIEKGLKSPFFAMAFAIIATIAAGIFHPPVQSNAISLSMNQSFGIPTWVVGLCIAALLGFIIIGGVRRIANVAQFVAPIMAAVYILLAIVVLCVNIKVVPAVFGDMLRSAFGLNPALAGMLGTAISWGVKRGIFSNEAGQGTGAIASASSDVSHPVRQGFAQSVSVYVDTLLVCTATAVMILACRTYNVVDDVRHFADGTAAVTYLQQNPEAPLGEPGVFYTSSAISSVLGAEGGSLFTTISLLFFAFTTIMAYYYYAETNLIYFIGRTRLRKYEKLLVNILRICTVCVVFFGSVFSSGIAWKLGDIGVGSMAWINLIAVILLSPKVFIALRDYERQRKAGKDPEFHPRGLGIENADWWETKGGK